MFSGSSNRRGKRPIISGDPTRGSIDDRLYSQEEINNNRRISPYNHPSSDPLVTPVKDLNPNSDEGWSERNSFFNNLSESFISNVLRYEKCLSPSQIKTNLTQHFNISPTQTETFSIALYNVLRHILKLEPLITEGEI